MKKIFLIFSTLLILTLQGCHEKTKLWLGQGYGDYQKALQMKASIQSSQIERSSPNDEINQQILKLFLAAKSDFDKVIKAEPKNAKAYYYRALVQKELNQKELALKDAKIACGLSYNAACRFEK